LWIAAVADAGIALAWTRSSREALLLTLRRDFAPIEGPTGSIVAGAIGERVRSELADRSGFETRLVVLGHVQRGGSPTPADRLLATQFGVAAVAAVHDGASAAMTALDNFEVGLISLEDATAGIRMVPKGLLDVASALGG